MDNEEEMRIFGENLRLLRRKFGLSQKELAAIMGIGVGSLRRIEKGDFPARFYAVHLRILSEYFSVSIDSMFRPMEKAGE